MYTFKLIICQLLLYFSQFYKNKQWERTTFFKIYWRPVCTEALKINVCIYLLIDHLHLKHNWWDFLSKCEEAKNQTLVLLVHVYMLINYYPIPLHFDRFVYPGIQNLNFNNINIVCNTSQFLEEPYSTENLHSLSGHLKFLSEPTPLTAVNFNDVQVRVQAQYRAFAAVMKPWPIFLNLMVISLLKENKKKRRLYCCSLYTSKYRNLNFMSYM